MGHISGSIRTAWHVGPATQIYDWSIPLTLTPMNSHSPKHDIHSSFVHLRFKSRKIWHPPDFNEWLEVEQLWDPQSSSHSLHIYRSLGDLTNHLNTIIFIIPSGPQKHGYSQKHISSENAPSTNVCFTL